MGNLLSSLSKTIHVSLAIAVLLFLGLFYQNDGFSFDALFWSWFARFVHVVVGIMWIGLLWYFNFVQIPNMAKIPDYKVNTMYRQKQVLMKMHGTPNSEFLFQLLDCHGLRKSGY